MATTGCAAAPIVAAMPPVLNPQSGILCDDSSISSNISVGTPHPREDIDWTSS
jgi:hypothetical protein